MKGIFNVAQIQMVRMIIEAQPNEPYIKSVVFIIITIRSNYVLLSIHAFDSRFFSWGPFLYRHKWNEQKLFYEIIIWRFV